MALLTDTMLAVLDLRPNIDVSDDVPNRCPDGPYVVDGRSPQLHGDSDTAAQGDSVPVMRSDRAQRSDASVDRARSPDEVGLSPIGSATSLVSRMYLSSRDL